MEDPIGKNAVKYTKGCVYIDDQLEADFKLEPDIINLMKKTTLCVLKELNIKTDLAEGPPKKKTKYLGWVMCAEELGIRLPGDKRAKILRILVNALNGDKNLRTNLPKKQSFLFSDREWSTLIGLLQFFVHSKPVLKPYLTPIFRAADTFATDNSGQYALTKHGKKNPPIFRRIPILEGSDLQKTMVFLMEIIAMNCLIPFQCAFKRPAFTSTYVFNMYTDAAGELSIFNRNAFGMGGICYELDFA